MQIVFSDDCRGQSVAAAKRGLCALYVHVTLLTVQMELWTTPLRLYEGHLESNAHSSI